MEVKVRGRIRVWSQGCIGGKGFGRFEGRGQDWGLGVLRRSWAILRRGWSLESWGAGDVSPGIGHSAPPCSPRHSDSSHTQCIAGDRRGLVRLKLNPFWEPPARLPPFPQLLTLITSHPELSIIPQSHFSRLGFPPSLWAGPEHAPFSPFFTSPQPQPQPQGHPPLPAPCRGPSSLLTPSGAAQASPSPSWTMAPASSIGSSPPVCPLNGPAVSFFTWNCPALSLLRALPPSPGSPGHWGQFQGLRGGLGTYVAEGAVATQGPWLVAAVLLGIVRTCGDRRAAVTHTDAAPPAPTRPIAYRLRHSLPHWSHLQPPPSWPVGWG